MKLKPIPPMPILPNVRIELLPKTRPLVLSRREGHDFEGISTMTKMYTLLSQYSVGRYFQSSHTINT